VARGISFDRVAVVYDSTRSLPPGVEKSVVDLLVRRIGSERTLEVGVGTARWAGPLEQRGVAIVGVDLGRAMLTQARRKGFRGGVQGDLLRLPFPDGSFDGALANHILHLVEDVPAALDELARVVRGRVRSVLRHETARPDLSERYVELAERDGGRVGPPGLGERELARRLPPDLLRDAAAYHTSAPARTALDALESRAFRDTWAVPEVRHREILTELRARFGDAEVLTDVRVEVAEWERTRLAAFAVALRAAQPRGRSD